MSAETRRAARHIAFGSIAIATVPVVGWFTFTWHVAIGLVVTLVYGAAAAVTGASSITEGAVTISRARRARREQKELRELPKARLLDRGRD